MNYNIIGYTEATEKYLGCGDYETVPGDFETFFFRDDQRTEFLKTWAQASFKGNYENMIILLNGVPDNEMTDEEFDEYEILEKEMIVLKAELQAAHDIAEAARREAAANEAVAKARLITKLERERDLQQLEMLKRKLGQS